MISVIILTKNEELHIAGCIESVCWADEVVVLDSESTDYTVKIAQKMGAKVFSRPFFNFAEQRNAAIDMVKSDWIFFVDADERVSAQLAAEITAAINEQKYTGFWIPRHNYQMGKLILHCGLYPDHQLRLFRKGKGHYDPSQKVHEKVILDGASCYLKHPLIHISCETWQDFIDHQKRYAHLKSEMQFERGVKPTYHFVAGPVLEFLRRYIVLQGYRDGLHGLYLSCVFAYYYFIMFVNLRQLWKTRSRQTAA